VPSDGGPDWHKTSQCVWTSAARLRGKISLNEEYEHLKELFVDYLGVKLVDLPMAIDELKEAGRSTLTSISDIKESIWTVNSLLSTESKKPSSKPIRDSIVFPFRYPNGTVSRASTTTEFFIIDREPLRLCFEHQVKFLDFELGEVARLRPFLEWTGLEDRYLSQCVKEITSVDREGARPMLNPERQIRNRAHALLRLDPVSLHLFVNLSVPSFFNDRRSARIPS